MRGLLALDQQTRIAIRFRSRTRPVLRPQQHTFLVDDDSLGVAGSEESEAVLVEAELHRPAEDVALLAVTAAEDDPHVGNFLLAVEQCVKQAAVVFRDVVQVILDVEGLIDEQHARGRALDERQHDVGIIVGREHRLDLDPPRDHLWREGLELLHRSRCL